MKFIIKPNNSSQLRLGNFLFLIGLLFFQFACSTYTNPKTGEVIVPEPAKPTPIDISELFPKSDFALPKDITDIRKVRKSNIPVNLRPENLPDLILRIQAGMKMPNLNSPQVDRFIETYANQASLNRVMNRAQYFLYDIVLELEKRNMPTELALLPIVESSFITNATSRAAAVGIWQFIPVTGKRFGLEQTNWLDERRDPQKSTDAALDYLEFLYDRFGNWHLALAAYNCGEGCVDRALRNLELPYSAYTYDDLPIPDETMQYAPRLQAVKEIFADPEKFGIKLPKIPNEKITQVVKLDVPIHGEVAAKLAGITYDEFLFLNAKLKKSIYHPSMGDILLPIDASESFLENLAEYESLGSSWIIHQADENETLLSVANRFGTSIKNIRNSNPHISENLTNTSFLVVPTDKLENGNGYIEDLPKIVIAKKIIKKTTKKTIVAKKKVPVKSAKINRKDAKVALKETYEPPKPATKEEILHAKHKALNKNLSVEKKSESKTTATKKTTTTTSAKKTAATDKTASKTNSKNSTKPLPTTTKPNKTVATAKPSNTANTTVKKSIPPTVPTVKKAETKTLVKAKTQK